MDVRVVRDCPPHVQVRLKHEYGVDGKFAESRYKTHHRLPGAYQILFQRGVFHAGSYLAKIANGKVSSIEVIINDD